MCTLMHSIYIRTVRWSTCPLALGLLLLAVESRDLSQAEKEIAVFKTEEIHKMTTQNGLR